MQDRFTAVISRAIVPSPHKLLHNLCGLRLHVRDGGVKMLQRFFDSQRVHFPSNAFAGFERGFQIMSGNLHRERVGNHRARSLVVFDPGRMRQGNPDFSSIHKKFEVYGVGVPRRDRDDHGLIHTMDLLLRPAIGGSEVLKHD